MNAKKAGKISGTITRYFSDPLGLQVISLLSKRSYTPEELRKELIPNTDILEIKIQIAHFVKYGLVQVDPDGVHYSATLELYDEALMVIRGLLPLLGGKATLRLKPAKK